MSFEEMNTVKLEDVDFSEFSIDAELSTLKLVFRSMMDGSVIASIRCSRLISVDFRLAELTGSPVLPLYAGEVTVRTLNAEESREELNLSNYNFKLPPREDSVELFNEVVKIVIIGGEIEAKILALHCTVD